jgi:hypothetical protein
MCTDVPEKALMIRQQKLMILGSLENVACQKMPVKQRMKILSVYCRQIIWYFPTNCSLKTTNGVSLCQMGQYGQSTEQICNTFERARQGKHWIVIKIESCLQEQLPQKNIQEPDWNLFKFQP